MSDKTQKKVSRRRFLRGLALAGGGAALAACAPKTVVVKEEVPVTQIVKETVIVEGTPQVVEKVVTATPAFSEPVTIRYWPHWGAYTNAWDVLVKVDEYQMFQENNITVEMTIANLEKILTATAAGTPPDVASGVQGQYVDLMARDVLLPLEELVATSSIFEKENFLSWDAGFFKGTQYAVPANEGFVRFAMNYNARLVEDAGLDPDSPPETWPEVFEWHDALTEFDDAGNLIRIGLDPFDAMGGKISFANGFFATLSWGWKWFDVDAGTFDLDNEMMAEAFEVMGQFYEHVGPDNMAAMRQVEGQGMWGGSYNSKVQAMMIDGYWRPGGTMIAKPEVGQFNRATWIPVPDNRRGVKVQGTGGHFCIIFKGSEHPKQAFKVPEFLNTDAASSVIFQELGWLPGRKSFLETADSDKYPGLQFYFDSVDEATEWHSPAPCPITAFVHDQWTQLREQVYRNEISASEAAAEYQSRCEAEYKAAGFA